MDGTKLGIARLALRDRVRKLRVGRPAMASVASAMVLVQPASLWQAAMAAPSEEASTVSDRCTARPVASARICTQRSEAAPPPMATKWSIVVPVAFSTSIVQVACSRTRPSRSAR
jgi:hypothetical protein